MESPIGAVFGVVLREKREAAGISQEQLADRAGLHRTYVSLIERGKRTASIEVVRKVAKALNVSMASLIDETEKRRG
ncbi:MAG TPA: helix-turn-helix transcriptional regulator [Gaiellaceae bacterium]|nr:helix-turn-helix transcriptional regulator [Gaiellaceae bacterium]